MLAALSSNLDRMAQLITFGDRLLYARALRGEAGKPLSGEALADLVVKQGGRMSKSGISELERGISKKADALNALYLARALRVRIEWLIAGEPPMEAERPPSNARSGGSKPKRAA